MKQVGSDGWNTGLLSEIVSFLSDPNVGIEKGIQSFIKMDEIEKPAITTKGWDIPVQWADQSTDWVPFILIKESNLVEVVDYVVANGYNNEPLLLLVVF